MDKEQGPSYKAVTPRCVPHHKHYNYVGQHCEITLSLVKGPGSEYEAVEMRVHDSCTKGGVACARFYRNKSEPVRPLQFIKDLEAEAQTRIQHRLGRIPIVQVVEQATGKVSNSMDITFPTKQEVIVKNTSNSRVTYVVTIL